MKYDPQQAAPATAKMITGRNVITMPRIIMFFAVFRFLSLNMNQQMMPPSQVNSIGSIHPHAGTCCTWGCIGGGAP